MDGGISEAETLDDAGAEVLQQHVGRPQQRAEHLAAAGVLEVERQAPFVAVEGEEEEGVRVRPVLLAIPRDISLARLLDLDHVGAEPGQDLPTRRPRLVVGDVDDTDPRERPRHGLTSLLQRRRHVEAGYPPTYCRARRARPSQPPASPERRG